MKKYVKGNLETHKDDDYIMGILREARGYDEDDSSHDDELYDYYEDNNDIFDALCDYEGLVGYGDTIRDWVLDVYDINLDDYNE